MSHKALGLQFKEHSINKQYEAQNTIKILTTLLIVVNRWHHNDFSVI